MEHMGRKIKAVRLFNKVCKLREEMRTLLNGDLQYQAQDTETKNEFYKAYDHLKAFIDNIR